MNITISNKDAGVKTRFEFAENFLLISTMFFTNTPPPQKTSIPSFSRKWKEKWFVKTVTWVPASFFPCLISQLTKKDGEQLIAWLLNNVTKETNDKEE